MRRLLAMSARWGCVALAILAAMLIVPKAVEGHAFLVRTTPQAGERLGASPSAIEFWFSEPVARVEAVSIKTASGAQVKIGSVQLSQGGVVVRAPLPSLGDGVYVVSWRVLAEDTHVTLGEFAFAVGDAGALPVVASQGTATAVVWPTAAAGWVFLFGLLLAFGALASERVVWRPVATRYSLAVPRLRVGWALVVALVGGAVQLVLLLGSTRGSQGWVSALSTRPILLGVVALLLVLYGAWLLPLARLRPWALLPLGLALVVVSMRGHPGVAGHWWAVPANAIHVLSVGLWGGALAHLLLVVRRLRGTGVGTALGEGARRYARLALGLVGLTLASGAAVALAEFPAPVDLVRSRYGQVLMAKLVLVAAALGLAVAARHWALPPNPGIRFGLLQRLTHGEALMLLLAIAAAGVLASVAPPQSTSAVDTLLGPPPLAEPVQWLGAQAGWLAVYVGAAPGQLRVQALLPDVDTAPPVGIELAGRLPDGKTFDLSPRSCGAGCVTTAFPWQSGTTTLTVTVSAKGWPGGTVQFPVSWPPAPENPGLLARVVAAMRAQPQVTVTERVTSGPGASSTTTGSFNGAAFMAQELYVSDGASDIRPLPTTGGTRVLTLYLPGSSIWFRLEIDGENRLQRETIVTQGHLIERSFTYDPPALPSAAAGREEGQGDNR